MTAITVVRAFVATAIGLFLFAPDVDTASSTGTVALPEPPAVARVELTGDKLATMKKNVFFFEGASRPGFVLNVSRAGPVPVELVRESDGAVVVTWTVDAVAGRPAKVEWDGREEGKPANAGRYSFRIIGDTDKVDAKSATTAHFDFYGHVFPIRAKHDRGESEANNFGGGRGHQGQDMFAECGIPIAAARGGKVTEAGFEPESGNYVVIAGAGTDVDYVYMHLRKKARVKKGDRVTTGQVIGGVGQTGRADGCHLHFELWSAPGRYRGKPFDPLPRLEKWDAYS